MNNGRPLISIIVPIYNAEKYLKQCVDSLVNQTYTNLEIILVNDGSKDSSKKICDEYAEKDTRITVIHKENEGVSETRNKGIDIANGSYIMFVDSDDWIEPDMCEVLFTSLSTHNVQSAMCSYVREYPGKSLPKILHFENKVFSKEEFRRRLCGPVGEELRSPEGLDFYNAVWGKIYPAMAIKNEKFTDLREIGTSEDMLYNLSVFSNIESLVCVNKALYHYRKSVSSSITSVYKSNLEKQWEKLHSKLLEKIKEDSFGKIFYSALNNRKALDIIGLGLNSIHGDASALEKYKRVRHLLKNKDRRIALKRLKIKHMPIHWKVFFIFAKCRCSVLLFMMLMAMEKMRGKV